MSGEELESGTQRGIAFNRGRVAEDASVAMTSSGEAVIDYEMAGGETVRVVLEEDDVETHAKMLRQAQEVQG